MWPSLSMASRFWLTWLRIKDQKPGSPGALLWMEGSLYEQAFCHGRLAMVAIMGMLFQDWEKSLACIVIDVCSHGQSNDVKRFQAR